MWEPKGRGAVMGAQMFLSTNDPTYLPKGVTEEQVRNWNDRRLNPNAVSNSVLQGKEKLR